MVRVPASRLPLPDDVSAADVPQYPVVLLHGMGIAGHALQPGCIFTTEVRELQGEGLQVFGPAVGPYNPAPVRAAQWDAHFRRIMEETGSPRLNLIGFSSGGLDARYVISQLGGHRYVASLTTVATPHHGSMLPDLLFRMPKALRSALFGIDDALARLVYPELPPDAEATLRELTPSYMTETFNPAVPDHPDVTYYSFASRAGIGAPEAVSPLMVVFNRVLYRLEGVNDGFVSTASARWSGYSGCVNADHAQLGGILDGFTPFDAVRFYRTVIAGLARQGF